MKLKLLLLALTLALLASIWLAFFSYPPPTSVMNELRAEGNTMIEKIEEYKKSHNRYPGSLSDLGLNAHKTQYGGWRYSPNSKGDSFTLFIGNYREYLFEIYWDSDLGEWHIDQ